MRASLLGLPVPDVLQVRALEAARRPGDGFRWVACAEPARPVLHVGGQRHLGFLADVDAGERDRGEGQAVCGAAGRTG